MTTQSLIDSALKEFDQKLPSVFFRIGETGLEALPSVLPIKERKKNMKEFFDLIQSLCSRIATAAKEEEAERVKGKIGWLRQWLNEDRITDIRKMVTNLQIEVWLFDSKKEEVHE